MRWTVDRVSRAARRRRYRAELPGKRLIAERDQHGWKCRLLHLNHGIATMVAMVQRQPSRKAAATAVLRTTRRKITIPDIMAALDKLPNYLTAKQRVVKGEVVAVEERKMEHHTVIRQDWEESERGWGVRPDGYTLHLTMEDRNEFVERFYADEKKRNPSGVVPDEYTRLSGDPKTVTVGAEKFAELSTPEAKKRCGAWYR